MAIEDFPDGPMVALLKRGLRGERRHQYTAEQLRQRNPEAHERPMARAKCEIAAEDAEAPRSAGRWHYFRRVPRSEFVGFRAWAFHLWNDFDLWTLRDSGVELTGIRLLGFEFEK